MDMVKSLLRPHAAWILEAFVSAHQRARNQADASSFSVRSHRSIVHDLVFDEFRSCSGFMDDVSVLDVRGLKLLCVPRLRLRVHFANQSRFSVNLTRQTQAFGQPSLLPDIDVDAEFVLTYEETADGRLDTVFVGRQSPSGVLLDHFELDELLIPVAEEEEEEDQGGEEEPQFLGTPAQRRERFRVLPVPKDDEVE